MLITAKHGHSCGDIHALLNAYSRKCSSVEKIIGLIDKIIYVHVNPDELKTACYKTEEQRKTMCGWSGVK